MRKRANRLGGWVLLAALAPAGAQALEPRWYVGGALGEKVEAGVLAQGVRSFGQVETADRSYKAFGGVSLGPYFGFEASRVSFGHQRLAGVVDFGFDVEVDGYAAAAVGSWSVGRLTLFGKAGSFWWKEEGRLITLVGAQPYSKDGRDLALGAGVKLEIVDHLLVRGEWERYEFDSEEADDLWLGLEVRF